MPGRELLQISKNVSGVPERMAVSFFELSLRLNQKSCLNGSGVERRRIQFSTRQAIFISCNILGNLSRDFGNIKPKKPDFAPNFTEIGLTLFQTIDKVLISSGNVAYSFCSMVQNQFRSNCTVRVANEFFELPIFAFGQVRILIGLHFMILLPLSPTITILQVAILQRIEFCIF